MSEQGDVLVGSPRALYGHSGVAAPDWAHTYFWAFLYYFLELLGGSRFLQGGTKSKN